VPEVRQSLDIAIREAAKAMPEPIVPKHLLGSPGKAKGR